MKLLVLTSEPISAVPLRSALPGEVSPEDAEVMVVAPALQESRFRFWVPDADEAIAQADEVSRATVEELGQAGIPASGDTGESDPLQAIRDALNTFPRIGSCCSRTPTRATATARTWKTRSSRSASDCPSITRRCRPRPDRFGAASAALARSPAQNRASRC